jgi:hypothetical protein
MRSSSSAPVLLGGPISGDELRSSLNAQQEPITGH